MRFLVDANLPRAVIAVVQSLGPQVQEIVIFECNLVGDLKAWKC